MKSGSGSGSDILCKERASEEGELEGKKKIKYGEGIW